MNTELIHQYAHTWRTFQAIVSDFSSDGWLHTGRGVITPGETVISHAAKYALLH